jgi:hypothetical protein
VNALLRYWRAFLTTLRMTMRGETPQPSPQAALQAWMQRAAQLADAALAAAEAEGLDQDARRERTLTAEGRRVSMETILASIRFHAAEEYPHLMRAPAHTAIAAIYATNLNDRFLAAKLFTTLETGVLREAVGRIVSHLDAIPPTPVRDE